jgi:hypothetical protein
MLTALVFLPALLNVISQRRLRAAAPANLSAKRAA